MLLSDESMSRVAAFAHHAWLVDDLHAEPITCALLQAIQYKLRPGHGHQNASTSRLWADLPVMYTQPLHRRTLTNQLPVQPYTARVDDLHLGQGHADLRVQGRRLLTPQRRVLLQTYDVTFTWRWRHPRPPRAYNESTEMMRKRRRRRRK